MSPIVTYQIVSSSGSCDTYMPTLDGKRALAAAITWSSVTRGASARIAGDATSVPSHCADLVMEDQRQAGEAQHQQEHAC